MIICIAILIIIGVDFITDKLNQAKEKATRKQKINLTLLAAVTTGVCSNANYTNYNYEEISRMILSQYNNLAKKIEDGTI
jgi:uncharacterized membrane protein